MDVDITDILAEAGRSSLTAAYDVDTAYTDHMLLTRAWISERCTPALLPYQSALIERVMHRFLIRSLLRQRLAKISKFAQHYLHQLDREPESDPATGGGNGGGLLSPAEARFLRHHQALLLGFYDATFLAGFPQSLRRLDDSSGGVGMVEGPDVDAAVVVRCLVAEWSNEAEVDKGGGGDGHDGAMTELRMREGDVMIARWRDVSQAVGRGEGLPRQKRAPPSSFIARSQRSLPTKRPLANVRKIIAVSSAKGGVGKSTISVNLALAFSRSRNLTTTPSQNLRVGILDADIFGPSIPTLLGLDHAGLPEVDERGRLVPLTAWGLQSMSMGYLLGGSKHSDGDGSGDGPVAWRGLMVMKALQQLLHEVCWPELDLLVIDMPPGTGDVQLTIGQQVAVDGAVIVSTPQDVALKDAIRGVSMFRKMDIPVLGMVQNMSVFVCPQCGHETRIFAHSGRSEKKDCDDEGLQKRMTQLGVCVLGRVPLDPQICYDADRGMPTIVAEEVTGTKVNSPYYEHIARQVAEKRERQDQSNQRTIFLHTVLR
ncbi:hypothetical protein DV736_g5830, partial [Chaetothyriales sp. CBS 134916]